MTSDILFQGHIVKYDENGNEIDERLTQVVDWDSIVLWYADARQFFGNEKLFNNAEWSSLVLSVTAFSKSNKLRTTEIGRCVIGD